jgi:hypothetical protein
MNLLWRTKPASTVRPKPRSLGVAVHVVAVVAEFSHDRADKHGRMDVKSDPPPYSLSGSEFPFLLFLSSLLLSAWFQSLPPLLQSR